jgi:hypothetical protein
MASTVPISLEVDRSDHASTTVFNASKALVMAISLRSQPSSTSEAIAVSDDRPAGSLRSVQMDNDFITDIASLAEETELYAKDADPIQNLEHLTEIADRATHFQGTVHLAKDKSSNGTLCDKLPMALEMIPEVLKDDGFGQSYSTTNNPKIRTGAFNATRPGSSQISAEEHPLPLTQCPAITLPSQLPLPTHSGDEDQITRINIASAVDATVQSSNEIVTNNIIRLRGLSKVSLSMNHKASMSCSFSLEVSEGSVLLRITSNETPNASFNAVSASGALSPTTSSPSHRLQSAHNLPRTFQHCFQSRARPIPHLLHPDVEGPSEEPDAPYTISFTERQYIATEGAFEERRWTTSLMYIFHEKEDRTTLCEIIFGKTLVMSAGTNKISYNGQEISHMSSIALWLDDATGTKSITLSPNLTGKRTTPKDIELKVHGLSEASKALRVLKTLTIVVELMPRIDEDLDTFAELERQSTATSGLTFLSKASATNSQKKTGPFKYNIEFTHVDDRQSFLSSLR